MRMEEHTHGSGGRHAHECGRMDLDSASLAELLIRAGYLTERKCGKSRGQAQILKILAGEGTLTQRELQSRLGIEAGSLSELLAKLEEKGFLERRKDERDRRRMLVSLTAEGQKAALGSREENPEEELFAVLKEEERKQLEELLRRLLSQWKAERTEGQRPER